MSFLYILKNKYRSFKVFLLPDLVDALKLIQDSEEKAAIIINDALYQAEVIKKKAQDETWKVFEETYDAAIASAISDSEKLKKDCEKEAKTRAKEILNNAHKTSAEIRGKALEKLDKALETAMRELPIKETTL